MTTTTTTAQSPLYFWSGSNRPGEIAALAKHNRGIGVAVDALDKAGRALQTIESLAPTTRVIVNVAQASGGRPILMIGNRRAALPQGDVLVELDGSSFLFGFRKIAVNVARATSGAANVLASILRGIFGPDAGARGKRHKVALELTREGWRLSNTRLAAHKASGAKVFVDSGAFGEVRFDADLGRMVDVRPITDADWTERLDAYQRIAKALGANCFLVAPDKVGDQAETLRRLARYADRVRALRSMGANIIVPLQRGQLSGADFDAECSRILGFSDYIRGIPSKKAAASIEEIAALSASLPSDARVHLLGLGPFGDRYDAVLAAIDRAPELVFCDSVRIKALVGRNNGPNNGPRILTTLNDIAKRALGLTGTGRLSPADADRVKFHALDNYFTSHFMGA